MGILDDWTPPAGEQPTEPVKPRGKSGICLMCGKPKRQTLNAFGVCRDCQADLDKRVQKIREQAARRKNNG